MSKAHSFHIPVMGIGYTIDTPLKISQYGMDSVISLVDDMLLEKIRKMYCAKFGLPYEEIKNKSEDYRAARITAYLNLMNELARKKFEELKNTTIESANDVKAFFNMLPDGSSIKEEFKRVTSKYLNIGEVRKWLNDNLSMGSIDVNIMTKVDKDNYKKGEKLPIEFNDAHAALRGFANSDLESSIVLSAGMNPRLYSYMEQFEDFYPDEHGEIKKKIILKVSDYKSALIQGKFLAKKGLWISEYRIESGLNCGGHAFATTGNLLGPILAEFRDNKVELIREIHDILVQALSNKNHQLPKTELPIKITAQGGVGTAEEHQFLIDHYKVDSVGWGTPFLLVSEATSVDDSTMNQLIDAREDDLYLSNISPLGIPFNSMRGNTKDLEKSNLILRGKPGSTCPKKYVALNNEFANTSMCIASRRYQNLKIKALKEENLSPEQFSIRYNKIVEKACTCVGLGTSALLAHNIETKVEGSGVSVCPGPNMAYFSKSMSLKEITDHIYGRANLIERTDRPNMFVKELEIYINYLKHKMEETKLSMTQKQEKYLVAFEQNLNDGIDYYQNMFSELKGKFDETKIKILQDLEASKKALGRLFSESQISNIN